MGIVGSNEFINDKTDKCEAHYLIGWTLDAAREFIKTHYVFHSRKEYNNPSKIIKEIYCYQSPMQSAVGNPTGNLFITGKIRRSTEIMILNVEIDNNNKITGIYYY